MAESQIHPAPASDTPPAPHRLWGGRFSVGPAPALEELNRSLPVDRRLWAEDVQGSRAWVEALARADVLTRAEARSLDAGLLRVADRLAAGDAADADDEDIHTLVERLLYEEVGDVAGKLHTGRSRNDQVATDFRLWALGAGGRLDQELRALGATLLLQAEQAVDLVMPAYTHLRRAQPVRVAHWLLSHFWALERDRQRLADALQRVSVLPLGSGAIAGCPFPVDRTLLKELLGFRAVSPNSIDAVGDRDWVCELVFVAGMAGAHLSRMAEDLILFSSDEFGFVRLPEAYTTGSSLMPQKRNPDGLELARGKAARLLGDVAAALAMLKGLPTGYNKDLQEDKTLLFGALDTLMLVLPATRQTIAGAEWQEGPLARAVHDDGLLATDLADELVRRGVPFREAHGAVGRLLRRAERDGVAPGALSDAAWAEAHPAFLAGPRPRVSPEQSVEARAVPGATARAAVLAQIATGHASLAADARGR
ncbi:MAG TPA: argininosuccinate lyase [Longimicrobiales bacterium]|nr:argininosuccinate lyase [Longimicrobiales bacterium]